MTKKYVKITPVETIQVTPYNYCEVIKFAGDQNISLKDIGLFHTIDTMEGQMNFKDFDYLIKNPTGECYVCVPEIYSRIHIKR